MNETKKAEFNLRDYLSPGGRKPYSQLCPDMERAMQDGCHVYLWSVAGHFVLSGSKMEFSDRHWSDGDRYYKTAKDCLDKKNGKR
jgi:hypothetical protein